MIEFLTNPWPWWFAGLAITLVMFLLVWAGKTFGFSSNLRTICAIGGAGKTSDFFRFDWKKEIWNLVFAGGALLGGVISAQWMAGSEGWVQLSESTVTTLKSWGIQQQGGLLPQELFGLTALSSSWKPWLLLALGGFLVGFGSRYAGGCTSGHAISGLSNLQLPSLIAVVGFFAGGLAMTWGILPWLLPWALQ
jgi:uncharacterized protein